jgi:septum formation topological specificity factor MinE
VDADAIYLGYEHAETFQGPVLELKSKTHNLVNLILKYIASDSDGLYVLFQAREDKSICNVLLPISFPSTRSARYYPQYQIRYNLTPPGSILIPSLVELN